MSTLKFQREIGDKVDTFDRNLIIIDREIRPKIAHKNGKPYNLNQKFYKYRCLDCGNEDWSVEYVLGEKMHCGCNACCHPPKKVVVGVNDITTTAPWMVKYFPKGITEAQKYTKYSNEIVELVCPDCGRVYKKQIKAFCSAKTLACVCGDGISYPNKYMYALLEQLNICFEKEKSFSWSESKRYDFYINDNEKIIVEMNGKQHYSKPINPKARTLEEEQENDRYKRKIAFENGIDKYFSIDCSESDGDFIKNNIIKSGLLESLNVSEEQIDWQKCDEIATSNLVKTVCDYLVAHKNLSIPDAAKYFSLSVNTVSQYIKRGEKYGWINYDVKSVVNAKIKAGLIDRHQKPIYCLTNDTYYRSASEVEKSLSTPRQIFYSRQIRKSIQREQNYLNHKFIYITRAKFNEATILYPTKLLAIHSDRRNKND